MKKVLICCVVLVWMGCAQVFAGNFTLTSDDLGGQLTSKQVFSGFGCTGQNISPALHWDDAPEGTKSFAVTVYDPDAPTGSGWWHWVVFNISAATHELKVGAGNIEKHRAPQGSIQSITDFGKPGFGGACPPEGDKAHRYVFTVYALNIERLELDATASPALVGFYIHQHILAKASLVAYYGR